MNRYISKSYITSKNAINRQYTERGQLQCQLLLVYKKPMAILAQRMCGGEILFAHGFKHSKGAMILFTPSLNVDILEISTHKNGRFLVANININQDDLCLVKYDAPNDQTSKLTFLTKSSIPFAVVVLTTFYLAVTLTVLCQRSRKQVVGTNSIRNLKDHLNNPGTLQQLRLSRRLENSTPE